MNHLCPLKEFPNVPFHYEFLSVPFKAVWTTKVNNSLVHNWFYEFKQLKHTKITKRKASQVWHLDERNQNLNIKIWMSIGPITHSIKRCQWWPQYSTCMVSYLNMISYNFEMTSNERCWLKNLQSKVVSLGELWYIFCILMRAYIYTISGWRLSIKC